MSRPLPSILIPVLALGVAGCAEKVADPPPPPPVPARLGELDPALFDRITATLGRLEAAPHDDRLRRELGLVYAANALNESARTCLEQVVARDDTDARSWYHLARVRAELGDLDGAIEAVHRVTRLEPDYAPAHWQLGLWTLDRGDLDEAETAFGRAVSISPEASAGRIGLALVALRRSDFERAANLLETYLETAEWNREYARLLLGTAYRGLGRLDAAEEALRRGRGTTPVWNDPWQRALQEYAEGYQAELERAKERAARGDFLTAIDILNDLKTSRSVTIEVYNNLGLSHMAIQEVDLAVAVLQKGYELNPNSLEVNHLLAGAYWLQTGETQGAARDELLARAFTHVKRALEINPEYVPALGLHADLLAGTGDPAGAIRLFREAARWEPDNPHWLYQAAMLHAQLRQWDSVVECLETVTTLSPTHEDALGRLGLAYMAVSRLDDAEVVLRRALSLNPDHAQSIQAALRRLDELRTNPGSAGR